MATLQDTSLIICRKCGIAKPFTEFKRCRANKDWINRSCNSCRNAYFRQYRASKQLAAFEATTEARNAEIAERCTMLRPGPGEPIMAGGFDWSWAFVIYRGIIGLEGYCYGSDGSIWSQRLNKRSIEPIRNLWYRIKDHAGKKGYRLVNIYKNNIMNVHSVHHLILMAFVGPKPERYECRHLNSKPDDNRIDNLWWGTRIENAADKRGNGTSLMRLSRSDIPVIFQKRSEGMSYRKIAAELGISASTIKCVLKLKYPTYAECL